MPECSCSCSTQCFSSLLMLMLLQRSRGCVSVSRLINEIVKYKMVKLKPKMWCQIIWILVFIPFLAYDHWRQHYMPVDRGKWPTLTIILLIFELSSVIVIFEILSSFLVLFYIYGKKTTVDRYMIKKYSVFFRKIIVNRNRFAIYAIVNRKILVNCKGKANTVTDLQSTQTQSQICNLHRKQSTQSHICNLRRKGILEFCEGYWLQQFLFCDLRTYNSYLLPFDSNSDSEGIDILFINLTLILFISYTN